MNETTTKKPRMSAEARRQQLIDVAHELLLEGGFHAMTIEAVARRSDITRAVVYQHFAGMDELIDAVIERTERQALRHVSQTRMPVLDKSNARDKMIESISVFVAAVRSNPDVWRLVLLEPDGAPERFRRRLDAGRSRVIAQMTSVVRPILAESTDAELTASVLSVVADHYARLTLKDPERYPPDRVLAHADWLVEGFLRDID